MIAYTILGIQTDRRGGKFPPTANMVVKRIKRIKLKLRANPNPICKPIPPRTFLEESETPMRVRIKVEKGYAKRLYFSIK